jgi:hypothetical protein
MSKRRRTLSFMVIALMLFCTAVFLDDRSEAAATPDESQQAQGTQGVTEREPSAPQAAQLREINGLRTADSKTFELADGNREWVGYTEPVHYKDGSGTFQEIDNSIVSENSQIDGANFAYRNAANEYLARFGAQAAAADLVNIEYRGCSLSFGLVGAKTSEAKRSMKLASRVLSETAYAPDCIVYPDVYPGIDLVYEAKTNAVKEYLMLREPGVENEFTFNFKLRGLRVAQTDDRITFVDNQGNVVFWLGTPVAFDDAEVPTTDVAYEIVDSSDGSCQVKVTLSPAYLGDPERVFPVILDPEVVLYPPTADTYVCSGYPTTNYVNSTALRTGRSSSDGIRRTFIKFTSLPAIDPDDVTDAHLRIERNTALGGVAPLINAWWSLEYFACETMTWSVGTPHWDGTSYDDFGGPESTLGAIDSGSWYHMHVTTPVQYWLHGTYPNCGWMIKDQRESSSDVGKCTAFYSSNYGSPHRPELHIVYDDGGSGELMEAGFWGWGHQPGALPGVDLATGMRDNLILGLEFDSFLSKFDANCQERQLRDPSKPVEGNYGVDNQSGVGFDSVDFAAFFDHGGSNVLQFPGAVDSFTLADENVLWGNTDLEWAYVFACNWFEPASDTHVYLDKASMAGAHGICAFQDEATWYGSGQNPDPIAIDQGAHFARYLRGVIFGYSAQSFVNAWTLANDEWQPVGTDLRCIYASGYGSEHLPDHGGMSSADPIPFLSGGLVVVSDHNCVGKVH